MTQDTPAGGSALSTRRDDRTVPDARVVLAADRDPAVTDELAAHLREYVVRTAHDSADALAALDTDVDVVLLDPELPGLSAARVVDRVTTDAVDCQVAALAAETIDPDGTAFDAVLLKPVTPEYLRETVERLAHRAAYRTTLSEYYEVAQHYGALSPDDPERDRLAERLDDLAGRLDESFDALDTDEAYDVALRDLNHSE